MTKQQKSEYDKRYYKSRTIVNKYTTDKQKDKRIQEMNELQIKERLKRDGQSSDPIIFDKNGKRIKDI